MKNWKIFSPFIRFYEGIIKIGQTFRSPILLLMRLYWGSMFFNTGLGKIQSIDKVAGFFETLGIPFPHLSAYLAGYTECIGGFCLLVGFASRLVSIPLAFTMIVALLTAHIEAVKNIFNDLQGFISQSPFNFLLTALIVFAFGPGKISVDYLLQKLFFKSSSAPKDI